MFATHNSDGTPKKCKFCGQHLWWDKIKSRWVNPDGKTFHVQTCATSKMHYHEKALDVVEDKRQRRANGGGNA